MTHNTAMWPTDLAELGFVLVALERDLPVQIGTRTGIVTPEAVFYSSRLGHHFLVESKANTFIRSQALRYCAVTDGDVRAVVDLPDSPGEQEVVAPVYFCQAFHEEALGAEIDTFNNQDEEELPLVIYDNHHFEASYMNPARTQTRGEIRSSELRSVFSNGIYFEERFWPTRYVPFDAESSELEIARHVMHQLTYVLMNERIETFDSEQLLGGHPDDEGDGALLFWEQVGAQAKEALVSATFEIVEEVRKHYLLSYLLGEGGTWRKKVEATDHPAQYHKVQNSVSDYLRRKEQGEDLPLGEIPDQMELDVGAES